VNLALISPPPIETTSLEAAPAAERYDDATAMMSALSVDLVVGGRRFVRAPATGRDEEVTSRLSADDDDTACEALATIRDRLRAGDAKLADRLFRLFDANSDLQGRTNVLRALFTGQLGTAHEAKLKRVMETALSGPEDLSLVAIAAATYLTTSRKRAFLERANRVRPTMSSRLLRALRAFEATLS
jgi:hypothetical protein